MQINTDILSGHKRIALHFSGGKDSISVAHLLKPHWDRLVFYHVDTGDLLPEVREIVAQYAAMVPDFRVIRGNIHAWHAAHGMPSDLVPASSSPIGLAFGFGAIPLVDRFSCCGSNLMAPMHARMIEDGVTLVIRGTKRSDARKLPIENGDTGLGYHLWLPILSWSDDDVFAYLREVGAPICRVYEHKVQAPECATCPAWWNEGRAAYLKKHHPGLFAQYREKLSAVAREIEPHVAALQVERSGVEA